MHMDDHYCTFWGTVLSPVTNGRRESSISPRGYNIVLSSFALDSLDPKYMSLDSQPAVVEILFDNTAKQPDFSRGESKSMVICNLVPGRVDQWHTKVVLPDGGRYILRVRGQHDVYVCGIRYDLAKSSLTSEPLEAMTRPLTPQSPGSDTPTVRPLARTRPRSPSVAAAEPPNKKIRVDSSPANTDCPSQPSHSSISPTVAVLAERARKKEHQVSTTAPEASCAPSKQDKGKAPMLPSARYMSNQAAQYNFGKAILFDSTLPVVGRASGTPTAGGAAQRTSNATQLITPSTVPTSTGQSADAEAVVSPEISDSLDSLAQIHFDLETPYKRTGGIVYQDLASMSGPESAAAGDIVVLQCKIIPILGEERDGITDASWKEFVGALGSGRLCKGLEEAVIGMGLGARRRIIVHPTWAVGSSIAASIAENAPLYIMCQLKELTKKL